ncbi:MAG: ABC transporter permease [Candidatus Solibacter sp.]|jgi:predicted permease
MGVFLLDLRYSLRTFRKAPGFALAAVLALAFGIGVNSAIFTLLNAIALRPLAVRDAAQVVTVYQVMEGLRSRNVHGSRAFLSYPEYAAYRDQNHVLTGLAAHASAHLTLGGPGARTLTGFVVSCDYFSLLAPSLALGRGFLPEECGAPGSAPVVVLSHRLWKGHYAANPRILGKTIVLNRGSFTIVGVAPEGFTGASIQGADVWAPFSVQEQWMQGQKFVADANLSWLEVTGRLKPGVSLAAARADLAVIAARADRQNPGRRTTLLVDPATLMNNPEGRGPVLGVGAVILAAVSLVLVIACANLANLLLARAVGRQKEIAVRLAVGASRGRLIRQLLTESLSLSAAGGVLGLLAAWATLRTAIPMVMARLPQEGQSMVLNPNPDGRIVLYSLGLALATGIGFGLIPALQASNPDLNTALKDSGAATGGRSAGWLRGSLVAAQIAVCLVLLIAAELLMRGLQAAQAIDPGFETRGIATAGFDLSLEGYDEPRAEAFHRQLAERLAARPGIAEVAFVDSVPLSGGRRGTVVTLEGKEDRRQITDATVSANYFQLLGIPMLRGRAFEPHESSSGQHVIVVSESTARRFWPGEDPVGKRLRVGDDKFYHEVVGVAKDIRASGLAAVDPFFVYFAVGPRTHLSLSLLARGEAGVAAIAKAIREETQALDANVLVKPGALADNLALFQLPSRILSMLALTLGLAGLLLASMGIYGVMAYAVTQRTREIGIRMTMGAGRRDVTQLVLAQAMRPVAIGVALGLAAGAGVSRVLASLLYGVSPLDPLVFAGVALFLSAVAMLAGYVPAQRASRVDPMTALRHF